jgi:hypothetical protein
MGTTLSRIVGVGCMLGALYCAQRSIEFRRHGEVVEGRVVAVDAEITHDGDGLEYSERIEIRYTPKSGGKARVLRSGWNNTLFGRHDVGDHVIVRYLPDHPDDAREDSQFRDGLLPLMLLFFGIAGVTGRLQSSSSGADTTIWSERRE